MKRIVIFCLAICLSLMAIPAMAAYPEKAITYLIPFGPGGQSDLEARRQQPLLEKLLNQKIVIQYQPGGGGSIGWATLIRKKPDGYFMAGMNIPHIILQPLARGNAGYETEQLTPVAIFQATPIGLAILKDSPIKSLEDLVAWAKDNPGALTCGGSGTWSGHHIANLQFSKMAGIKTTYIPAKGGSKAVAAFLGGHVKAMWGNSNDLVQHADKIRVLAFATEAPFGNMPDVPTFKSKGFDFTASIDRGAAVPPGTPLEVVKVLEKAFLDISQNPDVISQMKRDGFVPMSMDHEQAKEYIKEKTKEWAPIVKEYKK